jgi:hypothetical protein
MSGQQQQEIMYKKDMLLAGKQSNLCVSRILPGDY